MEWLVLTTARLIRAVKRSYARKWSFLGVFACAFAASVFMLGTLDLLPNAPGSTPNPAVTLTTTPSGSVATSVPAVPELPIRISVPVLNLSATVLNPNTTSVSVLDQALLQGAVRYPTSARLGEDGNVVIFGHSSYLPVIYNQAYKTFDGIQKLKQGDTVIVYSSGTAYTYAVRTVSKERATDGAIALSVTGRVLTLATCDSFGSKADRFVVTADFVESHSISG